MNQRYGYGGTVLRVNLTGRKIEKEPLNPQLARDWLGGRGFIAKLLYEELPRGVDPLSPENKLLIATGPLSGTFWPSAAKIVFGTKSPLTGGYGDSNLGGFLMAELKYAGYDMIILEGASEEPVYLYIEDDRVELREARAYWGKGALATEVELKKDLGEDFQIATIGPAGENLVRFANINHEYGRQAGRCGMGAVMGSKKLKAIAVRGTGGISLYDPQGLVEITKRVLKHIIAQPYFKRFRLYGTTDITDWCQGMGVLPTKNFNYGDYEKEEALAPETMRKKIHVRDKACFGCPLNCANYTRSPKYGTYIDGPEYETIGMLGSNLLLDDIEEVQYLNYLCDDYGIDTIAAGGTLAFAMECLEKGLLKPEDLDGIDLRFGNLEAVKSMLKKIAYQEGAGKELAKGSRALSKRIGRQSESFAFHVKGLEFSAYECRGAPAMLLSFMTSDIGAQHTRSWAIVQDMDMGRDNVEGRAKLVKDLQTLRPLMEMFGVCRFPWLEVKVDFEEYVRAFNAVTGLGYSREDLFRISEKVWNLTRAFWAREVEDFGRSYDLPPGRVYDPMPSGPAKGLHLTEEKVNRMLDEYYDLRGWNRNGIPTEAKLRELGLDQVAEDLKKLGKL
ncbi:MAG: aldehyde ferredoxin oxidoreductase family protein [Desulfobacterota bacterium]|nr:aldehyde ferredoxin oxidoreductase family protein [Thermodesulfobacteriota bacterium]